MLSKSNVQYHKSQICQDPNIIYVICTQWSSGKTLWTQLQLKISVLLPLILEWFREFVSKGVLGGLWLFVILCNFFSRQLRSEHSKFNMASSFLLIWQNNPVTYLVLANPGSSFQLNDYPEFTFSGMLHQYIAVHYEKEPGKSYTFQ